ncbi:Phosphoribosylformylglycinamidine synthase subunit PurQ [Bienertia sinuspersici]
MQKGRPLGRKSSLHSVGDCEEKVLVTFPKVPDEEVKDLMDRFPKGFNGFNCKQGERCLRRIAHLKAECWRLRRSYMWYPEFREEKVEGLPFPEGFDGGANGLQRPEASGSYPMETSHTLHALYHQHQQAASTFVPNPVQPNAPMFPGYMQFPPYWSPHMVPYGMVPIPWNPYNANYPPPPASYHSGMTKF